MLLLALCLQVSEEAAKFDKVFNKTPEQVVEIAGDPAGSYVDGDSSYWLYPNVVREKDGVRTCPELMFKRGKVSQVNQILEETMKRSIAAAEKFKDWKPPANVKEKEFFLADTRIVGKSRAEVVEKLGEPDGKKVFNGLETWIYRKVRISAEDPQHITVYVEWEDDKVLRTVG